VYLSERLLGAHSLCRLLMLQLFEQVDVKISQEARSECLIDCCSGSKLCAVGRGCLFLPHKLNARVPKDVCTLIWLSGVIVPSQQLANSISPETAQVATLPSVGPRCR
jgi:hypothetical protein